ncbi:MAG: orotidine 5'-phosphate decarboxylase / HUMPS family protein [Patescibacteria group bacterium]|jgi:orotidine-5'-phosphate decarboxylase
MAPIIEVKRSVVVAADVANEEALRFLAKNMASVNGISAFKLGITAGLDGLKRSVKAVKDYFGIVKTIYDHQKAGNDIPDMGKPFANKLKEAGVDAAILFPFTGPKTQEAWMQACREAELGIIVGGMMTHPKFLAGEGGYIVDDAPERIYRMACQFGVTDFVVPGNKLPWVERIRAWITEELGEGNFTLYAPGFITQGGEISACGQAAGDRWHAIVGSAIYKKVTAEEQIAAALAVTQQIAA